MGAQPTDPNGPNYDPQAQSGEGPVHEVVLSAFFLSKYELTQGQWKRLTGRNPSMYGPDGLWASQWLASRAPSSLLHPVEQVSWQDCMEWLPRAGLLLPNEAQWEYGARGSTETPFCSGSDLASLAGVANLLDAYAKSHGNELWSGWEADFDDGCTMHAAVGTFRANSFGLHEVHGNLWEWCLDGYDGSFYGRSSKRDPIAPWEGAAARVARGGGFDYAAIRARSAGRRYRSPAHAIYALGVRPARGTTE
jgi:formylglycine-generating enzyme required for sulfatase activity